MKKTSLLLAVCFLVLTTVANAATIRLAHRAGAKAAPMAVNGNQVVRYNLHFTDPKDMWESDQVQFCPDEKREECDGNIPFPITKTSDRTGYIDIPMEVIMGGQSASNLAGSSDWLNANWLFLPDCNLDLEGNLIFYRSQPNPNIPKSGGMHLLYVGPGAPFIPKDDDPQIYRCGGNVAQATVSTVVTSRYVAPVPAVAPAPVVTQTVKSTSTSVKKTAADDCTTCEKKIIAKVDEVKEDTVATRGSVGDVDKTEPVETRTIQAGKRKILKRIGDPVKPDSTLFKEVEQTNSTLGQLNDPQKPIAAVVEQTSNVLGQPKNSDETLIQIVEETRDAVKARKGSMSLMEWTLIILGIAAVIALVMRVPRLKRGKGINT